MTHWKVAIPTIGLDYEKLNNIIKIKLNLRLYLETTKKNLFKNYHFK